MALLKGVRRVVTTHDKDGKAIIGYDSVLPVSGGEPELGVETYTLWITDETPADNAVQGDKAARKIGIPPPANGSIFRIVDLAPTTKEMEAAVDPDFLAKIAGHDPAGKPMRHPGMHKTKSIDYIVVMRGEIDMLLDDSEVHLEAGDVLIQRGTIHAWVNRGKEVCRFGVVLIDAEPI